MSEKSNEVISILEDINLKLRVEVQLKDTRIKALEAALLEAMSVINFVDTEDGYMPHDRWSSVNEFPSCMKNFIKIKKAFKDTNKILLESIRRK